MFFNRKQALAAHKRLDFMAEKRIFIKRLLLLSVFSATGISTGRMVFAIQLYLPAIVLFFSETDRK